MGSGGERGVGFCWCIEYGWVGGFEWYVCVYTIRRECKGTNIGGNGMIAVMDVSILAES